MVNLIPFETFRAVIGSGATINFLIGGIVSSDTDNFVCLSELEPPNLLMECVQNNKSSLFIKKSQDVYRQLLRSVACQKWLHAIAALNKLEKTINIAFFSEDAYSCYKDVLCDVLKQMGVDVQV